jgi:hypothetical protein
MIEALVPGMKADTGPNPDPAVRCSHGRNWQQSAAIRTGYVAEDFHVGHSLSQLRGW